MDDASLARIGQWPWPRRRIAELTDKLAANGAASIAYDVLFAEPDRYAPGAILSELPDIPEREALRAALEASGSLAADPLAEAFSEAPVVTATALVARPTEVEGRHRQRGEIELRRARRRSRPASRRISPAWFCPCRNCARRRRGWAPSITSATATRSSARAPLLFALGPPGQAILVPSFAVEALRVAFQTNTPIVKSTNASGERAYGGYSAIVAVKIGDAEIPTDADGSVRIRYAGSQPGRLIPAWKVLAGEVDRDEIEGRIMLIGSSAAALADHPHDAPQPLRARRRDPRRTAGARDHGLAPRAARLGAGRGRLRGPVRRHHGRMGQRAASGRCSRPSRSSAS